MHVLVVASTFPTPQTPHRMAFLGQQVRLLSDREEAIRRITVVCPTTRVPRLISRWKGGRTKSSVPLTFQSECGRYRVEFPRYIKAPGSHLLSWTLMQWTRIVGSKVRALADEDPVDLIHGIRGMQTGWAAVKTARSFGIPSVVTYQGTEVHTILARRLKGWKVCRDCFRWADLNILVSRDLGETLREHANPRGTCEVLLRGVDRRLFFPAPRLALEPRVVFVGALKNAKGVFELVKAWRGVISRLPDARLTFVGPDYTQGELERTLKLNRLKNSVRLTGSLPPADIAELLRRSRLLCLPSHAEGTPNCVMEALSCGLPVVATRVGGIPDVVQHGTSGILVDPLDHVQLEQALRSLLRNDDLCREMGRAADKFAQGHLDAETSAERLVSHFQTLVSRKKAVVS